MTRPRRALLLASLALAGCGSDSSSGGEGAVLTVYLSAPEAAAQRTVDATRSALADTDSRVGDYAIAIEVLDPSSGPRGWTPARAGANARAATSDSTSIAYVGETEAAANRTSLPITNQARLLQVSPAPPSPDPSRFEPSGEPSFGSAPSGVAAIGDVLEAIELAEDPGDRESVIDAYLALVDDSG